MTDSLERNGHFFDRGQPCVFPGERVKRTRLIQAEKYGVVVEVEMVIPPDDPSEPCYEAETVEFLREVQQHAEQGDLAWLKQKGKLYAAVGAT